MRCRRPPRFGTLLRARTDADGASARAAYTRSVRTAASLACALVFAVTPWLGCNASTTVGPDREDGAAPKVPSDEASPSPPGTATTDAAREAASDADDHPTAASAGCTLLCNRTMAACSDTHAQFQTVNACLRACAYYPPGDPDDYLHDSLACRNAHADAAQTEVAHCHHAGAFGIDGCGSTCEGFCQLALGWCGTGALAPFPSDAECRAQCASFPYAPPRPDGTVLFDATGPTGGDSLDCRMYHLVAALEGSAARAAHCPLAAKASAACK